MLPMTFRRKALETLFTQEGEGIQRVLQILPAVIIKRVVPYFRKRGTDAALLARTIRHVPIQRLEDEEDRIHIISLLLREQETWGLAIHERIFDYLAFVIPSDPAARLGGGTAEEAKMLAFSEFLLRHQMEHPLYPKKSERDAIRADVVFAMDRRALDPTYYKMLRNALSDEMTGIEGAPYLTLFEMAEKDLPFEDAILPLLNPFPSLLADMPEQCLGKALDSLDRELKTRVLGELYRRSRDTSYSLVRRNAFLQEVLTLFALLAEGNDEDAEGVFNAFKERWGLVSLLHELDLPESTLEGKDARQVFSFFKSLLRKTEREAPSPPLPRSRPAEPQPKEKTKSLSDRIEEARSNPLFPRQALDVIDKNKMNAVGHSGPKFSELIETTLDIDLSNCHFMLTANTLETVPPAVVNRCEVIFLDRYSVEEKIAIAQQHLIPRLRERYEISEKEILFNPADEETELLRHLIKTYTREAGVRELERILRTLFLRILRKEILAQGEQGVRITREKVKQYLASPSLPRQINEESRVGEMLALGVDAERGVGSIIPVQATPIRLGGEGEPRRRTSLSVVHATGNIQSVMDESRKVATTGILYCADALGIDARLTGMAVHLHLMGGSTRKDGPSAGGAIALALASVFSDRPIRRDVAMTGEIDTQGRITGVGSLHLKLETAFDAGCTTLIIPKENLTGPEGMERLPPTLKRELQILTYEEWKGEHSAFDYSRHMLQVVAVDHIVQAADVALIDGEELKALDDRFVPHAHHVLKALEKSPRERKGCVLIFYVKDRNELELEGMESLWCRSCRAVLLHPPEVEAEFRMRWPALPSDMEMRTFDPRSETLAPLVANIQDSLRMPSEPQSISLVAPFFFIKQSGIRPDQTEKCRLFANNFTVQGVKIKTCKSVLNRVYCHLAGLVPEELQSCPFLQKREGIYTVDLSFIPEKYRLDVKLGEEILMHSLRKWLRVLEGAGDPVSHTP